MLIFEKLKGGGRPAPVRALGTPTDGPFNWIDMRSISVPQDAMGKTFGPHRYRVVLVGLLALCLGPATAGLEGWNPKGTLGAASPGVQFDALTISTAGDLQTSEKRIRIHRGDHHVMALHRPLHLLPPGISCLLLRVGGLRTLPQGPLAGLTIRAPPLPSS